MRVSKIDALDACATPAEQLAHYAVRTALDLLAREGALPATPGIRSLSDRLGTHITENYGQSALAGAALLFGVPFDPAEGEPPRAVATLGMRMHMAASIIAARAAHVAQAVLEGVRCDGPLPVRFTGDRWRIYRNGMTAYELAEGFGEPFISGTFTMPTSPLIERRKGSNDQPY